MKRHKSHTKTSTSFLSLQRFKEVLAIFSFFITFFLLISLLTYHRVDPGWSTTGATLHVANAGGRVGAWLADILLSGFGYFAFLFPVAMGYFSYLFHTGKLEENPYDYRVITLKIVSFVLLMFSGAGLATILLASWPGMPFPQGGGLVGEITDLYLEHFLNAVGTALLLWSLFLVSTSIFIGVSWLTMMDRIGDGLIALVGMVKEYSLEIYERFFQTKLKEHEEEEESEDEEENDQSQKRLLPRILQKPNASKLKKLIPPVFEEDEEEAEDDEEECEEEDEAIVVTKKSRSTSRALKKNVAKLAYEEPRTEGDMRPPLRLLDVAPPRSDKWYSNSSLETMSREVELRLLDFGVEAQVVAVHPGPVITRFELALAPGVKVSKISNLAKDLARSLSVVSVRIVDVIPGKSVIGLEVPNEQREVVYLSEIIASSVYEQSRSPLTLALGKDISWTSCCC